MDIQPIAGALGAEIAGVDLRDPISPALAAQLRAAFLQHKVIFLRRQPLTPAQFLRFAEAFGTPIEYPFVKGIEGFPMIIEVKKLEHEKVNFGGIWHSDTTYLHEPPMGSMLLSKEVPPYGGDTMFASQYAAYDALSPTMKRLLDGLVGIASSAKADVSKTREDRIKSDGTEEAKKEYRAEHPVVRTHPETGERTLFVNPGFTSYIKGLARDESAMLLHFLYAHSTKPEHTVRYHWTAGDLAFWDNRATQHAVVGDYGDQHRVIQRVTLRGDEPV